MIKHFILAFFAYLIQINLNAQDLIVLSNNDSLNVIINYVGNKSIDYSYYDVNDKKINTSIYLSEVSSFKYDYLTRNPKGRFNKVTYVEYKSPPNINYTEYIPTQTIPKDTISSEKPKVYYKNPDQPEIKEKLHQKTRDIGVYLGYGKILENTIDILNNNSQEGSSKLKRGWVGNLDYIRFDQHKNGVGLYFSNYNSSANTNLIVNTSVPQSITIKLNARITNLNMIYAYKNQIEKNSYIKFIIGPGISYLNQKASYSNINAILSGYTIGLLSGLYLDIIDKNNSGISIGANVYLGKVSDYSITSNGTKISSNSNSDNGIIVSMLQLFIGFKFQNR